VRGQGIANGQVMVVLRRLKFVLLNLHKCRKGVHEEQPICEDWVEMKRYPKEVVIAASLSRLSVIATSVSHHSDEEAHVLEGCEKVHPPMHHCSNFSVLFVVPHFQEYRQKFLAGSPLWKMTRQLQTAHFHAQLHLRLDGCV